MLPKPAATFPSNLFLMGVENFKVTVPKQTSSARTGNKKNFTLDQNF